MVMDGGEVTLELHGHYADEASARAAVRDYIEEWEFKADLTIGAGKLRLEFIRAEIVDRDHVFGDRHVPLAGYDTHRRRKTENGEPMQLRHE